MDGLGKMYFEHYIRVCGSPSLAVIPSFFFRWSLDSQEAQRRHPAPSSHPSRPSFENEKDMIKAMLREPPRDHSDAKQKVRATSTNLRLQPF